VRRDGHLFAKHQRRLRNDCLLAFFCSFFPVGTTTVMCTTTAGPSCSFTVTVNDTEGPHITVTTQTIELWPPNHSYHTINMSDLVASATDNC